MVKDFSAFLGAAAPAPVSPLAALGWQGFQSSQVGVEELAETPPVRVTAVHRSALDVVGEGLTQTLPWMADVTVGDWLMLNAVLPTASRVLERKTLLKRRAAGHDRSVQLIAANLDTAFVVTSCNADFNVARLERYLAVVLEAGVTPVILLTKADMAPEVAGYVAQARAISDLVEVIALNATGDDVKSLLGPWTKPGQTVGFLGTSGVGKSTLTNALGDLDVATGGIREDDARGRHTTTGRQLHIVAGGCAILDTPGMRELQLTDTAEGVGAVFADLEALAGTCKFRDCAHESEPGCAVRAAIAAGELDAARLARWQKLVAEDSMNSETLAERRRREKGFSKMVNKVVRGKGR